MADAGNVSEFVSEKLSEISNQLGQMTSQMEGLREDLKDESATSKVYREQLSSRMDNIAIRMGKAEEAIQTTKDVIDKQVMPLVKETSDRKLMISGALKFWGVIFAVAGGLSAVMWSRLVSFILYVTGHGPVT